MKSESLLGEKTWQEAANLTDKVVVIPLGAHEQHGHHLPLLTDALIGEEIVSRAAAQLGDSALFLSTLWLGCSPHHLQFPGTVSVSSDTYIRVIEDVVESLIRGGFRRLLFFNAHAGNVPPATVALNNVQMRQATAHPDLWLLMTSWFSLAARALGELEGFVQSHISHACEWETSQILAVRPDLVKEERPAARYSLMVGGEPSRFFQADYSRSSAVSVARRIDQSTSTGAFGWPEHATPEKGEKLYAIAAAELVALVEEFSAWPDQLTPQVSPPDS